MCNVCFKINSTGKKETVMVTCTVCTALCEDFIQRSTQVLKYLIKHAISIAVQRLCTSLKTGTFSGTTPTADNTTRSCLSINGLVFLYKLRLAERKRDAVRRSTEKTAAARHKSLTQKLVHRQWKTQKVIQRAQLTGTVAEMKECLCPTASCLWWSLTVLPYWN